MPETTVNKNIGQKSKEFLRSNLTQHVRKSASTFVVASATDGSLRHRGESDSRRGTRKLSQGQIKW